MSYVINNDPGTFTWFEYVMGVFAIKLIFDKKLGVHHFADVVVISTDSQQQCIGPDDFANRLGQIGHCHAMLVGSRCFGQKLLHQWSIEIYVAIEFKCRSSVPTDFKQGQQQKGQGTGCQAADSRPGNLQCQGGINYFHQGLHIN